MQAIASGQFVIEDSAETYMRGGRFNGARMLRHYRAALDTAIDEGYNGLRIAADMGWAVRGVRAKERLVEYERTLDVLSDGPTVVLCQYDRRLFDRQVLAALAGAHTHGAYPDPLHWSAQLQIARLYEPNGLQVSGEIDLSSRSVFRDALFSVARLPESRMVVDLSGVTYLDAGGVGAIVSAARHANRPVIEIRVPSKIHRLFEMLQPTLPATMRVDEIE